MRIRCWGTRGSVPVSGREYLRYGGDTTCFEIRTSQGDIIIIDAGSGIRALGNRLLEEGHTSLSLLFTHSHWDHLLGFAYFKPIYFKKSQINIYGCPFAQDSIKTILSGVMRPPYFPIRIRDVLASIHYHGVCKHSFDIGPVTISPVLLSHPNQGIGYIFSEYGKTFVLLTDNELAFVHPGGLEYPAYLKAVKDADVLFHDAMYAEADYRKVKGWGHSVSRDAVKLALGAGVGKLGLVHHHPERADRDVDGIVNECRNMIVQSGADLECFAVSTGMEIEL